MQAATWAIARQVSPCREVSRAREGSAVLSQRPICGLADTFTRGVRFVLLGGPLAALGRRETAARRGGTTDLFAAGRGLRVGPVAHYHPNSPPTRIDHTYTTHTSHTSHIQVYAPPPSADHPTGTGEEGQLLDNLRRRESRRSISTTKDEMGIPLPPRRNPLMRPSRCWTPL